MSPALLISRRAQALRTMEGELNALRTALSLDVGTLPSRRRFPDTAHAELGQIEFMADLLSKIRSKVAADTQPFWDAPPAYSPAVALTTGQDVQTPPPQRAPLSPPPPPPPPNPAASLPAPAEPATSLTAAPAAEEPTFNEQPLSYWKNLIRDAKSEKEARSRLMREPGIGRGMADQILRALED